MRFARDYSVCKCRKPDCRKTKIKMLDTLDNTCYHGICLLWCDRPIYALL